MKKMSKLLALLLAMAMMLALFAGCGGEEKPSEESSEVESSDVESSEDENSEDEPIAGGIETPEFTACTLPRDVEELFNKAVGELEGASYKPLAYLGSQIVAGTNYALLCEITPIAPDADGMLAFVVLYEDPNGDVTFQTGDINLDAYTEEGELDFDPLAGSWNVTDAVGSKLSDEEQKAFDESLGDLDGVGYEPIVCLSHQVVAGVNRMILCKATSVTADPISVLCVATIYTDPEGVSSVTNIAPVEIYVND